MSIDDRLRALGDEVAWPATPDLVPAVRARIATPRRPLPRRGGWALRPALAAVLAALVAGAAIPPARSAVLRVLGFTGSEEILRVDRLPPAPPPGGLDLGAPVTLARARALAPFAVRLPAALGRPAQVLYSPRLAGSAVTLRYGLGTLLTEFRGTSTTYVRKLVGPRTTVAAVAVRGARGYFVTGAPHVIVADRAGRVIEGSAALVDANALVWDRGGVAYRLETHAGLARALAIARSVR